MMRKLLLIIIAFCLIRHGDLKTTENGSRMLFSDDGTITGNSNAWSTEMTTLMPKSNLQTSVNVAVTEISGMKLDETMLRVQKDHLVENKHENYEQVTEVEREQFSDNTDVSGVILSGDISENSSEDYESIDDDTITLDADYSIPDIIINGSKSFEAARSEIPSLKSDGNFEKGLATDTGKTSHKNDSSTKNNEKLSASFRSVNLGNFEAELQTTTVLDSAENLEVVSESAIHILENNLTDEKVSFPVSTMIESSYIGLETLVATNSSKSFNQTEENFSSLDEKTSLDDNSTYAREVPITRLATSILHNSDAYFSGTTVQVTSEIISEDTVYDTNQNITEENNSPLPVFSTSLKQSFSSELSLHVDKEIASLQPSVNESPLTYSEEEPEDNSLGYTIQDNSTNQTLNVTGKIPPTENSTSENLNKSFTTNLYDFDDFPLETKYTVKNTPYGKENFSEESNASTSNSTNPAIYENTSDESESLPPKKLLNQTYKVILTRNCSGDALSLQTLQTLNSIFNNRLNAQNSTNFMNCGWVYEVNFTTNIASPDSFEDVIDLIKGKLNPDIDVRLVNYDSAAYQENFVVPKLMVYISSAATISMLIFMIFVVLCLRKKCRKSSTSVDLSDIPHLSLSVDDYKLTPIPRPSVSFPESNRDFLYAYSNETYSHTREDDTMLAQHHFSNTAGKDYDIVKFQKKPALALEMQTNTAGKDYDIVKFQKKPALALEMQTNTAGKDYDIVKFQKKPALALEMQTFNARGGAPRNRSEVKSVAGHEFASAGSWDRLKEKENNLKQGIDNPSVKW